MPLSTLNTGGGDQAHPVLSENELEIYYGNQFVSDAQYERILHSVRVDTKTPFPKGEITGVFETFQTESINNNQYVAFPWLSPDGLLLLFGVEKKNATNFQLYAATRKATTANFASPAPIAKVNSSSSDANPSIGGVTHRLYFERSNPAGASIFTADQTKDGGALDFEVPVKLQSGFGGVEGKSAVVSRDEKFIYYAKADPDFKIVVAELDPIANMVLGNPHTFPTNEMLNSTVQQSSPSWISADHCRLYFSGGINNHPSMYLATRNPK